MGIESIICRSLSGDISEEESRTLSEWLEESEENRKLFSDIRMLWNARYVVGNTDNFGRFYSFMKGVEKKIGDKVRRRRRRLALKVSACCLAAAVVAAALVLYVTLPRCVEPVEDWFSFVNTVGTIQTLNLDDGTTVMMKPGASLTIPKAFSPSGRNVLLSGEAYFDVARDESSPFTVSSGGLDISVLGTSFCVREVGESDVQVILEHGSVRLSSAADGHSLAVLRPDQQADFNAQSGDLQISAVQASRVIMSEYNLVSLHDASLFAIITYIEEAYKVRLSGPLEDLGKRYNFSCLRSNSLEDILTIVEYLTGNRYSVVYSE